MALDNLDFRNAIYCIQEMRNSGIYKEEKIGVISTDFPLGFGNAYKQGDIVLFRREFTWPDYHFIKPKPTKTVTVETPLSKEEISKNRKNHSLISTIGTIIGVPENYVREVQL
jgi:hypothetical protein